MDTTIVDPIHGKLSFPPVILRIVDTKEFQRLRLIKQLGPSHFFFPSAHHTRFEHCLGVCFLAGILIDTIEANSNVTVPHFYRHCVMIAGLLHDTGHGPFSHMWEIFIEECSPFPYKHEKMSVDLADSIFSDATISLSNDLKEHKDGVALIKALIVGDQTMLQVLLPNDKMYLSEIINNRLSEVDIDKWDYLLRDSYFLKNVVKIDKTFVSFYSGARISYDQIGVSHISYNATDLNLVKQLFINRYDLHVACYRNPKVVMIERMLIDMFSLADKNGFRINGKKLSEAHCDTPTFTMLNETVVHLIEASDCVELQSTKELWCRIKNRQYYKIVKKSQSPVDSELKSLEQQFGKIFEVLPVEIPKPETVIAEKLISKLMLHDEKGNPIVDVKWLDDLCLKNEKYTMYLIVCKNADADLSNTINDFLNNQCNNLCSTK